MKLNLLQDNILEIQNEYKRLLADLLPRIKSDNASEAFDEINLFWHYHISEVHLYLKNWISEGNTYVFTAATYLGFDTKEYLPFLLMGDNHIFDDTLCKYSKTYNMLPNNEYTDSLYNFIKLVVQDNLKLLDNLRNEVLIFPLNLINQLIDYDLFIKTGEGVFTSLFKNIYSIKDFFEKCKTVDDIVAYGCDNFEDIVMLSEYDDHSLSFHERFRLAVENSKYINTEGESDAYVFYMLVYGYIQQAVDIISMCIDYGCIPFIRHPVSLYYVSILSENMVKVKDIDDLIFKMNIAYIVYELFDFDKFVTFNLDTYLNEIKTYKFSKKLFDKLKEHRIDKNNVLGKEVVEIINDELKSFYTYFETIA